jgi:hydroxyethylthiazole kinase-like sugar kinase family protein
MKAPWRVNLKRYSEEREEVTRVVKLILLLVGIGALTVATTKLVDEAIKAAKEISVPDSQKLPLSS